MNRKLFYPLLCVLLLTLTGGVLAQNDSDTPQPGPRHSDPNWQATYWNNITLSNTPAMQRSEPNLDWDWGGGSPGDGVNNDHFSARWTRYIDVPAGPYRFYATSDDGIRVWLDNKLIIDQWHDQSVFSYSADVSLSPGHHEVRVEYYENSGFAVAKVYWEAIAPNDDAWRGSYFNNMNLSGQPYLHRSDESITFDWGYGSPAPGLPNDYFSARWTRTINVPQTANYLFTTLSDDGVRVYVDGNLVINDWIEQPAKENRGTAYLTSGQHAITVEYFEAIPLWGIVAGRAVDQSGTLVFGEVIGQVVHQGRRRGVPGSKFNLKAVGQANLSRPFRHAVGVPTGVVADDDLPAGEIFMADVIRHVVIVQ